MKSKVHSVIIIDDEEDIRNVLKRKLENSGHWNIIGEADSVSDAVYKISTLKPEVIFLDVKLIEGDAFKVLETLSNKNIELPAIVLNTGYAEFEIAQKVVNLYAQNVIMLLKKPFWENWKEKENIILDKLEHINRATEEIVYKDQKLIVRVGNKTYFIDPEKIIFIEVESTNSAKTKICTNKEVIIINKTLIKVKSVLPSFFIQVNRQAVINSKLIKAYEHEDHVLELESIKDRKFDVGNAYKKNIIG
jgi:DNA-binding LytR/AlgR family response regulator